MRDINRIKPFCDEIARLWEKYPDQRFGQFMMNVFGEVAAAHGDPFFPEDGQMMQYIKEISWLKD